MCRPLLSTQAGYICFHERGEQIKVSEIRENKVEALCNVSHLVPFQTPRKMALPSGSL